MREITVSQWDMFYGKCREYVTTAHELEIDITKRCERLIWAKWNLGVMICGADRSYGNKVCEKLVDSLKQDGIQASLSEVHKCAQFANRFPDVDMVDGLIGKRLTWTRIQREILPEGKEDKDNTLDFNMISHNRLSNMVEKKPELVEEHREELVGFLTQRVKDDFRLLALVDEDPQVFLDPDETGEIPINISERVHPPGDYRTFQAWVRTRPCVVCGVESYDGHEIQSAHYPRTAGAAARTEEHRVIPLCADHHRFQHDKGIETFMEQYGDKVLRWMQDELFFAIIALSQVKQ